MYPCASIKPMIRLARSCDRFRLFVGAYRDGATSNPASIAASGTVTSAADLPKYRWDAASNPRAPAPKYARAR